MKKIILSLIMIAFCSLTFCQNFSELSKYEFKKVENYKTEQDKVLNCANYLFKNPANKNDLNRLTALQYIMKWMEGTPDYTFEVGGKAMELTKGSSDLLGLYFAAMTKVVLENKEKKLETSEIYKRSEKILVDYCSVKSNKMKPSRKIKKIIKKRE